MRVDLLSLTLDALIVQTNRGLVNRSLKEWEAATVSATIAENSEGCVTCEWSDGIVCQFPPGQSLSAECCSCSAMQVCRHLIRSILAYQAWVSKEASEEATQEPTFGEPASGITSGGIASEGQTSEPPQIWNPGTIADEVLQPYFKPAEWKKLQAQYHQGQVIELSLGTKPTAQFHQWGITTRFGVPGEVRYAHGLYCSCGQIRDLGEGKTALCMHIPLAVWAFRDFMTQSPQQVTGLISTEVFEPIAPELLTETETIVEQMLTLGFTRLPGSLLGQMQKVQKNYEAAGWVWLSEILLELLQQQADYHNHDAQFQPAQVTGVLMELEARFRTMQAPHCPIPQLWIRGSAFDRPVTLGATTLVGLGCGVKVYPKQIQLRVYVQDLKSGSVLTISRSFARDSAPSFAQLAFNTGFKRFSLASLGSQQVVTKGGKRLPNQEFRPARNAAASLNPQAFIWENLQPPLLVDRFALLQEHLAQLPPSPLRPRRLGNQFWVLTIAAVREVQYSPVDQCIIAQLEDSEGCTITLRHPYSDGGRAGFEVLFALLSQYSDRLRFVAGEVRGKGQQWCIEPISLILEHQGQRQMFQPWIDTEAFWQGWNPGTPLPPTPAVQSASVSQPIATYLHAIQTLITDCVLLGLEAADTRLIQQCQVCYDQGQAMGFHHLLQPLGHLLTELKRRPQDPHWQTHGSTIALRELLIWLSLLDIGQTLSL